MSRRFALSLFSACATLGGAARSVHRAQSAMIGGVPITRGVDPTAPYLVFFEEKDGDAMLDAFCETLEDGRCISRGHPSAGGIPYVAVNADESKLEEAITTSRSGSGVKFVQQDAILEDDEVSSQQAEEEEIPWGLKRIGVPRAWETGKGVHIYVLDSGIRSTHVDFGGRAIPTTEASSSTVKVCDPEDTYCAKDGRGHGTHVAGSAGGTRFGVAKDAALHAMDRGGGYADAFASMDWLILNTQWPAVLTMSFGRDGFVAGTELALNKVVEAGVPVIVSAGNSDIDACDKTWAFISAAIVVGASQSTDERRWSSNWGSCVDIFAPGGSILSADYRSDYASWRKSGTSMAAPHVAGGVALLLEENPYLSPSGVRRKLLERGRKGVLTDLKGSPNVLLRVD